MLNSIILMGRLVKDPETFKKEGASPIHNFTLAVEVNPEKTIFIDCKAYDKEKVVALLHKGDKVAVSGALNVREFTHKDGSKGKATEVLVSSIEFAEVKRPSENPVEENK